MSTSRASRHPDRWSPQTPSIYRELSFTQTRVAALAHSLILLCRGCTCVVNIRSYYNQEDEMHSVRMTSLKQTNTPPCQICSVYAAYQQPHLVLSTL